jgi:hypothetical protein
MDLAGFWSIAPLWASVIILIVIAIVFRRILRARKSATPMAAPDRSWGGDEANLDSSHIGGPIFVNPLDHSPKIDAEKPPRGSEPAGNKT